MRPFTPAGDSSFHTTRWSMVLQATQLGASGPQADEPSRAALGALCEAYWYPLYVFVRRQGLADAEAQDAVQGFFTRWIEKRDWDVAPERGRFRTFLLAAMRNFLANEWKRARADRRGGGRRPLSIDRDVEGRYALTLADPSTPERLFERQLALAMLDGALAELEQEQARACKAPQFQRLRAYFVAAGAEPPYALLASELGISEGAARVAVHRLRKRYGELLRRAVADLVADPADVEDEIRALLAALSA